MKSLVKIVKNNEINISASEWQLLNDNYSKEEIKQMISDAIADNNLQMPLRQISLDDALNSFEELKSLNYNDIIVEENWFTRYEYKEDYFLNQTLFTCNNKGNKTSDFYQQENRWLCDSINSPSPWRNWNIEKFRLTLLNALWGFKKGFDKVDSATLRSCIGLRKYISSQFRPSTAKAVYDFFGAKNVLDFSSGWGDRLCGFMASESESYFGVDPNERLHPKYNEMINELEDLIPSNKQIQIEQNCAENIDYGDRTFDLIFTSPPYFNIERYTQEDNQSWKKYKKLDKWLNNFLYEAIGNAWNHLEKNGTMIINISDVYSNHTVNKICDPMNNFIDSLPNSEYIGCAGYEMRKRPNSKSMKGKSGKFAEPMWMWRKTDD